MSTTHNLALPLIAAAQAQKHVTHNEALGLLDALVQIACLDKDRPAPPPAPAEGDRYLVPAAPDGAWTGLAGQIACFQDGVWIGLAPRPGWLAYLVDEGEAYLFTGAGWTPLAATLRSLRNLAGVGVNAVPDAENRLAVNADGALFSWDETRAEAGDVRLALNKRATGRDAALSFQTGFSARALLGLIGGDDLALKVSADGAAFVTAFTVAAGSGRVRLPAGLDGTPVGAADPALGRFSALALVPASADPGAGTLGQIAVNSTERALKWFDGARWARIANLAKFSARTNYDNYIPAGTWTKVAFNEADSNDQGSFRAAQNRFVAPEAGLYRFGAALTYRRNGTSQPTLFEARLYRSGAPAGHGRAAAASPLTDGVTGLLLDAVLPLAAGETIEVFARFTGADGYAAAADSAFHGAQLP
ncbi:DUF2793 domain-containing protein [Methylobacterium radiodurans]|uniref:C1q domain-containing protein n=1 Tax=Methylobacterium radiodurans TaxID=2202828 RepID=A0A2U8VNL9_9HYPH|nr:DUF2793 domain-containing protein [Methylobacterium radiodurans]AWN35031.1 hypothetical protein DK427_04120 [Methylobacterium radiodurans]